MVKHTQSQTAFQTYGNVSKRKRISRYVPVAVEQVTVHDFVTPVRWSNSPSCYDNCYHNYFFLSWTTFKVTFFGLTWDLHKYTLISIIGGVQ